MVRIRVGSSSSDQACGASQLQVRGWQEKQVMCSKWRFTTLQPAVCFYIPAEDQMSNLMTISQIRYTVIYRIIQSNMIHVDKTMSLITLLKYLYIHIYKSFIPLDFKKVLFLKIQWNKPWIYLVSLGTGTLIVRFEAFYFYNKREKNLVYNKIPCDVLIQEWIWNHIYISHL